MTEVADQLAPFISFFNVLGFAAAVWLLVRVRRSSFAPFLSSGSWILVVGTGLHAVNDYVLPLVGADVSDDAYDHLFIHIVLLAALVAFAVGVARAATVKPAA